MKIENLNLKTENNVLKSTCLKTEIPKVEFKIGQRSNDKSRLGYIKNKFNIQTKNTNRGHAFIYNSNVSRKRYNQNNQV